jgi:hypothetical protein
MEDTDENTPETEEQYQKRVRKYLRALQAWYAAQVAYYSGGDVSTLDDPNGPPPPPPDRRP